MFNRNSKGFVSGGLIGVLGGLIGLGGAEFRLPVLIGFFKLPTLEAVVLNKAMSLVVVTAALLFRVKTIPLDVLFAHAGVVVNLLAGSLIGAWWAAGCAMTMSRVWLDRCILVILVALSLVMFSEALLGIHTGGAPLIAAELPRVLAGFVAGLGIGMVAALLGVAGGELLIPTIVLLYGLDIKVAGSLSLMVSFPTMIVGFIRYTRSTAFAVIRRERPFFCWMAVGSVMGSAIGGLLLGAISTQFLMLFLAVVLLISAVKTFQHSR